MNTRALLTHKTTGHLTVQVKTAIFFIAALLTLVSLPAFAFDLHVMVSNDPVFGNSEADDKYTAGLGFEMQRGFRTFAVGERMFTDREAGERFDETYLTAEQRLAAWGNWEPTVGIGVLHIGRGLLGESVQNRIHKAIGSDVLDLDYLADNHWYGEVALRLERGDVLGTGRLLSTRVELKSAPGFRSWLRATTRFEKAVGTHFTFFAGGGFHAEEANLKLLEQNVESWGPTAELGIAWKEMVLRWSYNDYGTKTSHLTLGIDVPLRRITVGHPEGSH